MEIGLYLVERYRTVSVYDAHSNAGGVVGNDWATVGGLLTLPAGTWLLNGKASIEGASNDSIFHLECLDVTGAQFLDDAIHRGDLVDSSLGLIAVHGSPVSFNVAFVCRDLASSGGAEEDIEWRDVRINAVKATTVTRVHL